MMSRVEKYHKTPKTFLPKLSTSVTTRTKLNLIYILLLIVLAFSLTGIVTEETFAVPAPQSSSLIPRFKRQAIFEQFDDDFAMSQRPSYEDYLELRQQVVDTEHNNNFESDVTLTTQELRANDVVMAAKNIELETGHANPHTFSPSQHFFDVLDKIKNSKLFKIIRRMPKGGILHAHDTGLCSTDYVVSLTYREHLWQCNDTSLKEIVDFRFSRNPPASDGGTNLVWVRVTDERARIGHSQYDAHVRTLFTLKTDNPRMAYNDINDVWTKFNSLFALVTPIVTYVPVYRDYYKQALKEALQDNVQYLEFRGILPPIYDLDGTNFTQIDVARLHVDVLEKFKQENPEFIGSKLIYASIRTVSNKTFNEYLVEVQELHRTFPDFVCGFDLVGQEDLGRKLSDFVEQLLQLPETIKFFFHAGETNWYGSVDENLIDAILLGSLRFGHGYALAKHPTLLQLVKEHDVAIEINPLSNQVLKLVDDFRNHPAAVYFATNVPLVISSDDPSFWEATPLSHDFYEAFLGIASGHSDLRKLKKLATNSIKYSSLNDDEKQMAFGKWQSKWDQFIDDVIVGNF